jgi:hypothetical protein
MIPPTTSHRIVAALCMVLGAFPIGMAIGLIPTEPVSMHAPRYIVALAGLLFWVAAGAILFGSASSRLNHLFGGVLLAVFAIIGGWVAIFGGDNSFGGIPFASQATNGLMARAIFGSGAISCAALSVYAFGRTFRRAD